MPMAFSPFAGTRGALANIAATACNRRHNSDIYRGFVRGCQELGWGCQDGEQGIARMVIYRGGRSFTKLFDPKHDAMITVLSSYSNAGY